MTNRFPDESLSVEELNRRQDEANIRDILVEKDVRVAYLQSQRFRAYLADFAYAMKGHGPFPPVPDSMPTWAAELVQELVGTVQVDPAEATRVRVALCGEVGHLRRGYAVGNEDSCSRCGGKQV